ncbi:dynamin-like 120 kDa protein, mitochondrial isoform X3 [Cimex lectularius]|uniref:Dynamin-like GTPase OPA1, mitochondrial n=1 Tax=Cimex lectularius TaxID=79782 RepID=A0A8I6TE46_CIMLE|nr:dynamin-like 120 kDa protein, mitochondrial isoform X3 [Cimex lectularius]
MLRGSFGFLPPVRPGTGTRALLIRGKDSRIIGRVGRKEYHHWSTGRERLLLRDIHGLQGRRGFAMFVARAIKGVLKLRYLVLGGAVGGGVSLHNRYKEWVDSLPDMSWAAKYMPSKESMDMVHNSMTSLSEKVKNVELDPRLVKVGEENWSRIQDWLNRKLEEAYAAADERERAKADKKVKVNAITFSASSDKREEPREPVKEKIRRFLSRDYHRKNPYEIVQQDSPEKRVERLKQELIEVQLKYQKEIEKLEKDNKELKKQILLNKSSKVSRKQIKKSLIDMYSEVLDELSDYDANYSAQDHLPRVVVVGDQSSGKTSVLEMIAKARIFPRGAGEMMTRAPVKVTLSEGPYHIAQFKDSDREFDLTKEDDLAKLRTEVELRMKRSLSKGKSVSQEVIAMTVKGPGIQRMVLVDLPGIISTVTKDMAKDTRESIREMIKNHMSNPNSIVLCIQDGSVDAERSNITDLVAQIDPAGKRTIFVLTKVDMAEENLANPLRIQKILSGRLFPMKALGYFAVVTGRGRQDDSIAQIQEYEEQFFRNSKLFRSSSLSSHQLTTRNLSFAVSECFWKMVRETVEQQADLFKAERFNLETEWKNTFPSLRELDRDELFDKARGDILDEVVNLSQVSAKEWDILLAEKMWDKVAAYVVDNIYLPAAQAQNPKAFNTVVDIRLKEWAERKLAELSIEAGQDALRHEFVQLMESSMKSKSSDHLFDALKRAALEEALKRHKWEDKGNEMLRMIQLNTLEDRCVNDKQQWDSAILLLEKCLKDKLAENESVQKETFGPGTTERWLHWKSTTEAQRKRSSAKNEIEKILYSDPDHGPDMTEDELTTIKKNLERLGVRDPTKEMILEAWPSIYLRHFLHKMMRKVYSCRKGFYLYHHNKEELECQDVVLFWRMEQMLKVTANALRQQVMNREARRLDKIIKEVLEDFSEDRDLKVKLLTGRRVTLAEELKRVRQIQEKLEEFIQALNKEK